jgi:5-keto 4-deoxyuronate isomerase
LPLLLLVAALGIGSWAWVYVVANKHEGAAAAAVANGPSLLFNITVAVPALASNMQSCSRWFGSTQVNRCALELGCMQEDTGALYQTLNAHCQSQ